MSLEKILEIQRKIAEYNKYHYIEQYDPYPFQRRFHQEHGLGTDKVASQVALICANQIGKTTGGGAEVAFHATGDYPTWWEGKRFNRPVIILVAGVSNDSTKRIIQKELLGGMEGTQDWGTGMIPKDRLGKPSRKAGVPDAYESVVVKGKYGDSLIWLMAYEQGWQKFQGIKFDYAWLDEEPPLVIWSQALRGTIARPDSRIAITMTPEEGITEVVHGFRSDLKDGQAMVTATWDDAKHDDDRVEDGITIHKKGDTHLTEEKKKQIFDALPAHQREMRSKGIPTMGTGLVFPVREEEIVVDPFKIPAHWRRVCGIDFGIDHPFAAAWIALDGDTDTVHLYDEYRVKGASAAVHIQTLNSKGQWIPVVWPHDGLQRDKSSGVTLADFYRNLGANLLPYKFSNPPAPGQKEGQGGQGVEAGLVEMMNRMETGRFKVHSNCQGFLEERRMYHRKDEKIVKLRDDIISATRYAVMSLRFAYTEPVAQKRVQIRPGASNW